MWKWNCNWTIVYGKLRCLYMKKYRLEVHLSGVFRGVIYHKFGG